jgi:hypothetical protein
MRTDDPRTGRLTASPHLLTGRQLRQIQHADEFAAERHAGQLRPHDGAPFIEHPREVSRILPQSGAGEPLVVAGLLHDVLEKTATTEDELRSTFGQRVTALVTSVTGDGRIDDRSARLADLRGRVAAAGPAAGLLFAADRISKLPELATPVDVVRTDHELASLALLGCLIPRTTLLYRLSAGLEAAGIASDARPIRPHLAKLRPLTPTKETS